MKNTLIFREIGNYIHILNYSLGRIQSFKKTEGRYLIDNLGSPLLLKKKIDTETYNLLFKNDNKINSRKIRSPLFDLGLTFSFPTVVNIELNRRCLLRCKHCYISLDELSRNEKEVFDNFSSLEIKNLFASLKKVGVFLIVLTGGEPFLNKNFQKILKKAIDQEFIVEIFSNLQYLPEWFLRQKPFESKIGRIQTSIYSVDSAIHDQVTNKVGSLKKTLHNLLLLKNLGYYVEVATPLMSINYESRHRTQEYFAKIGIPQTFSWPIVNEYYSGKKSKASLNISKEQFVEFCGEHRGFIIKMKDLKREYFCAAGRATFAISALGDVFPCSQYPLKIGNIKIDKIEKILKSKVMNKIKGLKPADLLVLLAYQIGSEVSLSHLAQELGMSRNTIVRYLDLLEKSFVVFQIRGFSHNLRSEVTKNPRYCFWDNGVRNAIINNFNPLRLRGDIGQLWENFLAAERVKRNNYRGASATCHFWRTYNQQEVDWVEETGGKLQGFEFKWKKDAVAPSLWREIYPGASFQVINQENYLDFLT